MRSRGELARCAPQQLSSWWGKLAKRILVAEALTAGPECNHDRQDPVAALQRRAYVYVRQSTTMQVLENTESTGRQYGLVDRARRLGWSSDAIDVIDEDLGRSGATSKDRSGFRRLAGAVAHGKAEAIFAVEVPRLARSSQDWRRLLALCAVAQVVVADEHAVYDPQNCDDKLLLDFKERCPRPSSTGSGCG